MKINPKKSNEQSQLRQWTKEQLTDHDFSFAFSFDKNTWDSLSHRLWRTTRKAGKNLVADMLDWEIRREFEGNPLPPFRPLPQHEERISSVLDLATLPKNSQIEPLKRVFLPDAIRRNGELSSAVDEGIRVHAFEIERDEPTEVTVNRFRNWLVQHKRELLAQYAKPRSRHRWIANVKHRNATRGRRSLDAVLRALAVYRLKMAGYSREEAEGKLKLKRYALSRPDSWSRLPAMAMREIWRYRAAYAKISLP